MIELLVVLAILALAAVFILLMVQTQTGRGRDARRKADLEKIKVAFEEYFNDEGCYPPADILDNCGGPELEPYLDRIPCDPFTQESYVYLPEGGGCSGYRLFSALEDTNDPQIARLGCDGPSGCGFAADYNYGISVGVPLTLNQGTGGNGSNTYACAPNGVCNIYANPTTAGCPLSWLEMDCADQCDNPANRCSQ